MISEDKIETLVHLQSFIFILIYVNMLGGLSHVNAAARPQFLLREKFVTLR